ncbi:hypothetical protein Cva_01302 [Caedimonas varicaedens]|uniref:YhdP central domain-containing protein n=1 Tax=Caedimonas varicaedens TaxID=1629334 RepID=A0A0K8MEI9_9PROT|nr:hypothetical protein Cva_01302 [Caedimonas varicaedens]
MNYKSFKKAGVYFLRASFMAVGLTSVLMLALVVRLHQGPLSLEAFKPTLQRQMEKLAPDFVITLDHPEMIWKGLDNPFRIHFRKIGVKRREGAIAEGSIGSVSLTYNITDLLTKGISPAGIEIESPHFTFEGKDFFSFLSAPQKKSSEKDVSLSLVHSLLRSNLKLLKISQARITLHDPEGWGVWTLPSSDIVLKRSPHEIEASVSTLWKTDKFSMLLRYLPASQEIAFSLSLPRLSTSFLKSLQNNHFENASDQIKKIVQVLRTSVLDFSLQFDGHYHFKKGIELADLQLTLFEGILDFPEFLPKILKLQEGKLKITARDNLVTLESCQLKSDKKTANIKGTAVWNPETQRLPFELSAEATQVLADSLKDIWPHLLAPLPRQWVLGHISRAVFPRATCTLKGEAFLDAESVNAKLHHLQGKLEFVNGDVKYMDELPTVEGVNGIATYNMQDFKIQLTKGQSAGLKLTKGQIDIHGLDQEDQTLEMKLDISSSLPETLKFIDLPPLKFAQKYDMDKMNCHGDAHTTLAMTFPLITQLSLSQIQAQATSQLSNVSLTKPLESLDVSVSKGDFSLRVDSHKVLLQGRGFLNNAPSQILWERALSNKFPDVKKLKVDFSCTPLWLKSIGFNLPFSFTAAIPTQISYSENKERKGVLEITSDLTPAEILILGWTKRLKNKGNLSIVLDLQNDVPQLLRKFSAMSVDGLKIDSEGVFDKTGKAFKSFKLHHFTAGQNQFHGTLTRDRHGRYDINVNGQSLNIESFLKEMGEKESTLPEEGLAVKAKFDKLQLDPEQTLFGNSLDFYSKKGRFLSFEYAAYLRLSKKKENLIHAMITSLPNNTRRLTLQTPAAGKLLKAFGFPLTVYEGLLQLYAIRNDAQSQGPWEGKLRIQNFSVKDVPVLGQILSLAFPTGMVDLFSDKGLSFQQFRTRFSLTPRKLIISNGHAQGASLGMTIQGNMDRSLNNINLSGSVIPAYVLNSLLSKIPLLGEIITGGKHEGIFSVSYTVQGSRANPIVRVNPVSLFTPGFLRKIFDFDSNESEEEKNDLSFDFEGTKTNP